MEEVPGLVLIGNVVGSPIDEPATMAWLRDLADELDEAYSGRRIASFGLTQDGELQGLLEPDADPIEAVLRAALHSDFRPIRWAIVRGPVHRGRGRATHRVGTAFMMARHEMEAARDSHERLVILSGDEAADELLADLNPILADLLDGLTERQRTIARLAILQQLRQSEIADRLGVRAATISVSFSRARLRSLQRLVSGIRRVYANAIVGGP